MFRLLAGTAVLAAAVPDTGNVAPNSGYNKQSSGYAKPSAGYDKSYDKPSGGYDKPSGGYGKPSGGYDQPSGGYGGKDYGKQGAYGGGKPAKYGGYSRNTVTFPPAYAIIDPNYYSSIFSGYQTCLSTKCGVLPSAYSATGVNDCISTIAAYTSCVTACAGAQAFETVEDFRTLLEEVIVIGNDQLRAARQYLSGLGDLDVIGERVHIGESCCLPNSYFAGWDRILVPVKTKLKASDPDDADYYGGYHQGRPRGQQYRQPAIPAQELLNDGDPDYSEEYGTDEETESEITKTVTVTGGNGVVSYMISASEYLNFCLGGEDCKIDWLDTNDACNAKTTEYLQFIQRNLGHLILAPSCEDTAPDGACCTSKQPNPRAVRFTTDVCVATTYSAHGKTKTFSTPLIKPAVQSYHDPCPCDTIEVSGGSEPYKQATHTTVTYELVNRKDLLYYTVATGLPSKAIKDLNTDEVISCEYNAGLVDSNFDFNKFFTATLSADESNDWTAAARLCPTDGLLEYCNVDQYASFLEYQLFDHASCDIADLRLQHTDYPSSYQTIACLYKIFSLKCDCMEAVLACYSTTAHFGSALSKVIGQAASILCGFILCQRPNIYSLFGDEYAIDKASIMRQLLASTGILSAGDVSPAVAVFVSFGLGMVALVATKKIVALQRKPVEAEGGYENLI
ncbi:hypothetical protein ACHHYP_04697 [Achlya hypogyna]|uniref:Secreted protein n=1 Tax=Achlya hypogyna TaxID=1202772 RepID=A0A1V9Z0H3_ACHHY|nr:hypothetical protein ACHHYP_04697 [Achlya hypogyna]